MYNRYLGATEYTSVANSLNNQDYINQNNRNDPKHAPTSVPTFTGTIYREAIYYIVFICKIKVQFGQNTFHCPSFGTNPIPVDVMKAIYVMMQEGMKTTSRNHWKEFEGIIKSILCKYYKDNAMITLWVELDKIDDARPDKRNVILAKVAQVIDSISPVPVGNFVYDALKSNHGNTAAPSYAPGGNTSTAPPLQNNESSENVQAGFQLNGVSGLILALVVAGGVIVAIKSNKNDQKPLAGIEVSGD